MRTIICLSLILSLPVWAAPKQPAPKQISSGWVRDAELDLEDTVSKGRYITGGVIGSTLGFGVGHGIQRRYRHYAWIFTIGESAAIGWFAVNTLFACEARIGDDYNSCVDETNRKRNIAALFYFSFRIWEAIDVWTGVKVAGERVALAPAMVNANTPGLLFAFKF